MPYVREPFEKLDVMNYFMFNKLTTEPEIAENFCKCLLRNLIGKEVSNIVVEAEKIEFPDDPSKRGVRLDVQIEEFGKDKTVVNVYDIEAHRDRESNYPKKNRFQLAQIDKGRMKSGDNDFSHLPNVYIICITNYDPFGEDQIIYTIRNQCVEVPQLEYDDGVRILYFNTTGTKGGTKSLKSFLEYLEESTDANAVDEATCEVKNYVDTIRNNYVIGGRYMTLGNLMDKWKEEIIEEVEEEKNKEIEEKDKEIARLKALLEKKE